jgi:hypothetical protein
MRGDQTPAKLAFGEELNSVSDVQVLQFLHRTRGADARTAIQHATALHQARVKAQETLEREKFKYATRHDENVRFTQLQVGDTVFLRNQKPNHKFSQPMNGPFIIDSIEHGTAILLNPRNNLKTNPVNIKHLIVKRDALPSTTFRLVPKDQTERQAVTTSSKPTVPSSSKSAIPSQAKSHAALSHASQFERKDFDEIDLDDDPFELPSSQPSNPILSPQFSNSISRPQSSHSTLSFPPPGAIAASFIQGLSPSSSNSTTTSSTISSSTSAIPTTSSQSFISPPISSFSTPSISSITSPTTTSSITASAMSMPTSHISTSSSTTTSSMTSSVSSSSSSSATTSSFIPSSTSTTPSRPSLPLSRTPTTTAVRLPSTPSHSPTIGKINKSATPMTASSTAATSSTSTPSRRAATSSAAGSSTTSTQATMNVSRSLTDTSFYPVAMSPSADSSPHANTFTRSTRSRTKQHSINPQYAVDTRNIIGSLYSGRSQRTHRPTSALLENLAQQPSRKTRASVYDP